MCGHNSDARVRFCQLGPGGAFSSVLRGSTVRRSLRMSAVLPMPDVRSGLREKLSSSSSSSSESESQNGSSDPESDSHWRATCFGLPGGVGECDHRAGDASLLRLSASRCRSSDGSPMLAPGAAEAPPPPDAMRAVTEWGVGVVSSAGSSNPAHTVHVGDFSGVRHQAQVAQRKAG